MLRVMNAVIDNRASCHVGNDSVSLCIGSTISAINPMVSEVVYELTMAKVGDMQTAIEEC